MAIIETLPLALSAFGDNVQLLSIAPKIEFGTVDTQATDRAGKPIWDVQILVEVTEFGRKQNVVMNVTTAIEGNDPAKLGEGPIELDGFSVRIAKKKNGDIGQYIGAEMLRVRGARQASKPTDVKAGA